jgi:tRNA pseudouridine65 synthase
MDHQPNFGELIVYSDEYLVAACKPAGVPVHGSRILEGRPMTLLGMLREQLGQVVHPVHRLDRAVSGLMLLARDRDTLADLARQFERREPRKRYLAVVRGWLEASGEIDRALGATRDERTSKDVPKSAVTRWRRLQQVEVDQAVPPYATARYSLLQLQPLTGRRHQLRRHMKHLSHPIIGDTTYGRGEHNRLFRERFDCHRLLLHARSLEFLHPHSGLPICLHAGLDEEFRRTLEQLGWTEEAGA